MGPKRAPHPKKVPKQENKRVSLLSRFSFWAVKNQQPQSLEYAIGGLLPLGPQRQWQQSEKDPKTRRLLEQRFRDPHAPECVLLLFQRADFDILVPDKKDLEAAVTVRDFFYDSKDAEDKEEGGPWVLVEPLPGNKWREWKHPMIIWYDLMHGSSAGAKMQNPFDKRSVSDTDLSGIKDAAVKQLLETQLKQVGTELPPRNFTSATTVLIHELAKGRYIGTDVNAQVRATMAKVLQQKLQTGAKVFTIAAVSCGLAAFSACVPLPGAWSLTATVASGMLSEIGSIGLATAAGSAGLTAAASAAAPASSPADALLADRRINAAVAPVSGRVKNLEENQAKIAKNLAEVAKHEATLTEELAKVEKRLEAAAQHIEGGDAGKGVDLIAKVIADRVALMLGHK